MTAVEDLFEWFVLLAFGAPRFVAVFAMIPIFNQTVVPSMARNAIIVSMVLFLQPFYARGVELAALSTTFLIAVALKEIAIGLLIGFAIAALFWAVESAGFFIDNQRGSTMASSVDPLTGSQTSPLGIFLTQLVAVFFMVGGGFLVMLTTLYESYRLFPVFELLPAFGPETPRYFLGVVDRIMALAIVLAAPALIAMFLSEFGLGLVSRFAPQLNVFFLAMPVKSAVGILMLILYVKLLPEVWNGEIGASAADLALFRGLLR
jgi:type III secretion protein T